MLALNAPPGQDPVRQPFVHYRCHCNHANSHSSKSGNASEGAGTTPSAEPGTGTGTGSGQGSDNRDAMNIDDASKSQPASPTQEQPSSQTETSDTTRPSSALVLAGQQPGEASSSFQPQNETDKALYSSGNHSDTHGSIPLSRLYFCDSCDELRCPKCVQDEIVCYYCPHCLFDAPTASVKTEKHKCSRNCFYCPLCQATLSVVSEDPDATLYQSNPTDNAQYYLLCNMCLWNSQDIGVTFDKPLSLTAQLQKDDEALPDVREFARLKDHFEKYFRSTKSSLPSYLASPSYSTGYSSTSRYLSSVTSTLSSHRTQQADDIAHYTPAVQVMESTENLEKLMSIVSIKETTTMKQRLMALQSQSYSPQRLQPQRIHLRIKKLRRCRSCRHILVKPDQKGNSFGFKINLIALNQLPNITIVSIQRPMIVQTASQVILRFTNPRHEEAHVSLQYGDGASPSHGVAIRSPSFSISPFNEVWEYEVGTIAAPPGATMEDVYERTANSTCIALDITPAVAGEVK
ncbi:hypothetical protein BGW38_000821, partial [Lunasporangiospora selenospora]